MTSKSPVAPRHRLHVQTTASELRDGYPYFKHHDSISALWSTKWRAPCSAGIYPFTDGRVEDFDPIFEQLSAIANDDPAILRRPDDYATPFLPVARDLVAQAERAHELGQPLQARELFLRGAAIYRIARFPVHRSTLGEEAWTRGKAAYKRGGALLDPPSVEVAVPFAHVDVERGDRAAPIQANLRMPRTQRPHAGWPVLLFICGLDAYRTDHTPRTQAHVDRGFATLSFEIPGTGDCPAAPNDPGAPDRLMSSVLDWVDANASTLALDASRIVVRGISTGGYYAMRIAHTHADRLFAAVAQGGGCHHMFEPAWILAQNQMEYPFALADALACKFGYRDPDPDSAVEAYAADAMKFSLIESGIADRSSCRMLIINGMEDSIFPIEDSFLVASRGVGKDLIVRGSRAHMGNPGAEELLYDWIDSVVRGRKSA